MKTLVTIPTLETRSRLERIFMNSPVGIDFSALLVPLAFMPTNDALNFKGNDSVVYSAVFTDFRVVYDDNRNQGELVGILSSDAMKARSLELGMSENFILKLVFLPYTPSASTTVRNFNVSIADTLVMRETQPFTFSKEYVL